MYQTDDLKTAPKIGTVKYAETTDGVQSLTLNPFIRRDSQLID